MISSKRIVKAVGLVVAALLAVLIALFLYYGGPGGNGTLASLHMEDGSEYKITQTYNWSVGEPYTVDFFMRSATGPWGWCYIDHESHRWRNVAMFHDRKANSIVVTEQGIKKVVLNREQGVIWTQGLVWVSGFPERPAPQAEAGKDGVPQAPD